MSRITDEGVCLANGDTLASIELTPEDRDQLLQKIETFVLERGRYQKDGVWQKFKDWCAEAKAEQRYDLIIDGANVGYHKQNYAGAPSHVAYNQIDAMARLLKAKGFKPVIVLHRYVQRLLCVCLATTGLLVTPAHLFMPQASLVEQNAA